MKEYLSSLPLFKEVPPEHLNNLIKESKEESFEPGDVIIEFGHPGRYLGIILEGYAEAVVDDPTKGRIRLNWLDRGDFFGEMALITGEPSSVHVVAHEHTRILFVSQESFTAHLATNPATIRLIAETITTRLKHREFNEDVQDRLDSAWRKHPDPYGFALQTTEPIKLLVINCGSSSLKYNFFDTEDPSNNARGLIERIGEEDTRHLYVSEKAETSLDLEKGDHASAFKSMVETLTNPKKGVVKDVNEIRAVGHRVVHGGNKYNQPTVITEEILEEISGLSHLAPLHNPLNVMGIRESMKILPETRQVAVFDTAFHYKIPMFAHLYGLPYEYYQKYGIRRFGFHGLSHNFVALKAAEFLKKPFSNLKFITCHLGNGASVCAIDHGRSVDTSMGLTPTEGLIMGTRCGDMDPSAILYLQRDIGLSAEEVDDLINRQSGLKGISGISNDLREIEAAASQGDRRALLAKQLFCYRIKKYIGSYAAAMGGLDVLIFTGGIGEGSTGVRARVCQGLNNMGIMLDEIRNQSAAPKSGEVVEISDEDSLVKVLIVPTDEERMIARETIRTLGFRDLAEGVKHWKERHIPIEVSAHHVHLSGEDTEILFGKGYELTFRSELSQPGQFACNETVNIKGPKGNVDRVRVLGPFRKESQVEVSISEEFKLGVDAPIRPSGELKGTPGITLEGPKGKITLPKGVICSLRHIHMSPEDALFFGLRDKDMVRIRVEGERSLIFGDVLVRVNANFKLAMHLDTDEANAAEIRTGMVGFIDGLHDRK
ncbi:MAG: acetate/propionate family kinase [Candidatus Aminicenantes bacterium]|nr:acetate/propionate family kinase [Candidatus Aminicenantes bacterium]